MWLLLGAGGLYLWSKSSSPAPQVPMMGQSAGVPPSGSAPGLVNLTAPIFQTHQAVILNQEATSDSGKTIPAGTHGNVITVNSDGTIRVGFDQAAILQFSPNTPQGITATVPSSNLQAAGS
jgi:hypothetical protein